MADERGQSSRLGQQTAVDSDGGADVERGNVT